MLLQFRNYPTGLIKEKRYICFLQGAIFCFVDDYLIVGDSERLTALGCAAFEGLLKELSVELAPHKRRGPVRCLEFLGKQSVSVC